MTDFEGIRALTFDCYGTLIDWECGLLAALRRRGWSDADVMGFEWGSWARVLRIMER